MYPHSKYENLRENLKIPSTLPLQCHTLRYTASEVITNQVTNGTASAKCLLQPLQELKLL
jgi:hypothetical protein